MTRDNDVFYVHEKYARRLGNRRFIGGLILGGLIVFTTPFYKYLREYCKTRSERDKKEYNENQIIGEFCETCKDKDVSPSTFPCNLCKLTKDNKPSCYVPNTSEE